MRKNCFKKYKFCKCVLNFNFEPITGYGFFISLKKSNSVYLPAIMADLDCSLSTAPIEQVWGPIASMLILAVCTPSTVNGLPHRLNIDSDYEGAIGQQR